MVQITPVAERGAGKHVYLMDQMQVRWGIYSPSWDFLKPEWLLSSASMVIIELQVAVGNVQTSTRRFFGPQARGSPINTTCDASRTVRQRAGRSAREGTRKSPIGSDPFGVCPGCSDFCAKRKASLQASCRWMQR